MTAKRKAFLLLGWTLGMGPVTPATPVGPSHFALVPVAEGVYAAIAKPGDRAAVGNAGFVVGRDGVVVVDSFAAPEAAEELLAEIRRITRAPVRWVVNTHYHLDHVGGDRVFAKQGAVILAHENVRAWVRTENLKWRDEIKPEEKAMLAALALPDVTYHDGLEVWPGDQPVEVLTKPGHTGGDSIVFFPSANVLFAGDLFWRETLPNLIDADTREWIKTLDGFAAEHPAARFVPGHGQVGSALDVRYFRDYLVGLRSTVERALAEGKTGPALTGQVLPLLRKRYASWNWFDQFAEKNIESVEQELRGTKKMPPRRGESPK
ncbi:MAG TPA: MBL fold metallo-hydrolase [Thermoanaerobaculia bacterium]|nr:MBL fold metallo-hydrolase [Thermoanaerobaculia bacterium]